jgi:CubicO group peptidase (beta-lactamase class C family)
MRTGSLILLAALAAAPLRGDVPAPLAPLWGPEQRETRATLLRIDGRTAAKRYAPGYSDANRFISWSMAKTVTALLVGELVADGRLALDAPAPIAEWQGDARRAITLRHLLHMSAGLRHIEVGKPVENSDTNQVLFVSGPQAMAAAAIARPLAARPGTRFRYDTLTSVILAEIVTRTLTDSRDPRVRAAAYRAFAEARLFRPAGVRRAFLEFDGAGTQIGGSIIHMPLEDWGRMGELLIDGRGADGGQVIAPDWLAFLKSPAPTNPEYGGHLWLNRPPDDGDDPVLFPQKGLPELVSMNGHLGQFVMAVAQDGRRVVMVRLGNTPDDRLDGVIERMGDVIVAATAGR